MRISARRSGQNFPLTRSTSLETLRMELLKFDRTAIERIIPVLSGFPRHQPKNGGYLAALLKENDSAQAENLVRRIYYTSDGEKPKKIASVVTEKLLKDNPWIREWLSQEMSRCLALIEQIDNLTRIEATVRPAHSRRRDDFRIRVGQKTPRRL